MKKTLILATAVLLLCSCIGKTKKNPKNTVQPIETASIIVSDTPLNDKEASGIEKTAIRKAVSVEYTEDHSDIPDTMYVNFGGDRIMITPEGKLFKNGSPFLNLSVENGLGVEKLYFIFDTDYIIAIYTEGDSDASGSHAERISLTDKKSIWQVNLGGFNMATPVYDDKYIYVSTIGGVYKLDYITGEFDWKFEDMYGNGKYNSFKEPEFLADDLVLFTSTRHLREIPDSIIVDNKNKKIISKK